MADGGLHPSAITSVELTPSKTPMNSFRRPASSKASLNPSFDHRIQADTARHPTNTILPIQTCPYSLGSILKMEKKAAIR
jgi:hypothetical protein